MGLDLTIYEVKNYDPNNYQRHFEIDEVMSLSNDTAMLLVNWLYRNDEAKLTGGYLKLSNIYHEIYGYKKDPEQKHHWLIDEEAAAVAAIILAFLYMVNLLAVSWVNRRYLNDQAVLALCILFAIGLILAQLLVEVAARYHYVLIPILLLTAGFAFQRIRDGQIREK